MPRSGRVLAACALPALAIAVAWLRVEEPRRWAAALVVSLLALVPALVPGTWRRAGASAAATFAAAWVAFGAEPWELLPYRDEAVLGPLLLEAERGLTDFYSIVLPYEPARSAQMHALTLSAIFGFTLAVSLLVATRRPVAAAAVTVAAIGWPATLMSGKSVAVGAVALAAALSIPLVLRARSLPSLAAGAVMAAAVVGGATWASSATTIAREAALDWNTQDLGSPVARAVGVRFVWDANYDGIAFPSRETVVLEVTGPSEPRYWRTSTLDMFLDDHWFENHQWLGSVGADGGPLPLEPLTPRAALRPGRWLEQRVEVKALVDDRLAAAGTPRAVESDDIDGLSLHSGALLRVRGAVLESGDSYRMWSYAPDPGPGALERSPSAYPPEIDPYLGIEGWTVRSFGEPGQEEEVRGLLTDPSYDHLRGYVAVLETARQVAGHAETPYAAVLALESWFRTDGGFRYEEQPPRSSGPPLVAFVTTTREGYCQHYAGAMALMLRMLGIPARVAVGFTSGSRRAGKWVVTDHDAHAWVEAWFAGLGWVPFDPTPGRGNLAGGYSFASGSEAAVEALRRGDLQSADALAVERRSESAVAGSESRRDRAPSLLGVAFLAGAGWVLAVGALKWALRRSRRLTRDPRRSAGACARELEAFLRDQGVVLPERGSLDDLGRAVQSELGIDGRPFVDAAARARYGPPDDAPGRAALARHELRALLTRARRELSAWQRVRGLLSLRSLRAGAG
jgi:transglutaminase-like putative cysteine protease